jgi:hypothetical protein
MSNGLRSPEAILERSWKWCAHFAKVLRSKTGSCTQAFGRAEGFSFQFLMPRLFQQPVDFHLTSGAEVDASVHNDRDHETCRQGRAVALAVLL